MPADNTIYAKLSDTFSKVDGAFSDYEIPSAPIPGFNSDGPVGYWPLNENVGSTSVADRSGNFHNAVPTDVTFNSSYGSFNGTSSYINMSNHSVYYLPNDWTLETWIYPTAQPYNSGVIAASDLSYTLGFGIHEAGVNNSRLWVGFNDGVTTHYTQAAANLPDADLNTWIHIAGIKDGNQLLLYRNGLLISSLTIPGYSIEGGLTLPSIFPASLGRSVTTGVAPTLYVGRRHATGDGSVKPFFPGRIALPAVYNKALTADQVYSHYSQGIAVIFTGNVAYASISDQTHYNLRNMSNSIRTYAKTIQDLSILKVQALTGQLISTLGVGRAREGQTHEDWTGQTSIGPDATRRMCPTLTTTFTAGQTTKTLKSVYQDDLLTGFEDTNKSYFIDMVMDATDWTVLASGYISFSSNPDSDHVTTADFDKVNFTMPNGGPGISIIENGTIRIIRFPRTILGTNVDISDIRSIQVGLTLTGAQGTNKTFHLLGMRMYELGYTFPEIEIDTKGQYLRRSLPALGAPENGTTFPPFLMAKTRPKNFTQVLHFNTGTHPVLPAKNTLSLLFRYDKEAGTFNEVRVDSHSTGCTIKLIEQEVEVSALSLSALVQNTDYYLRVTVEEDTARMELYKSNKVVLTDDDLVADSGIFSLTRSPKRGHMGLVFWPYNYDFVLYSNLNRSAEFGRVVSQPFPSFTPIRGLILYTDTSQPIDILPAMDFEPKVWTTWATRGIRVTGA